MQMNWNGVMKKARQNKNIIITVILLILASSGAIQKGVAVIGGHIHRQNDQYLDKSIKSTLHLMIPVGGIKALADVVEGSTAVVEWGDIAQPILDYVDITWRILILSLIVSTATKYTLLGIAPFANTLIILSLLMYVALSAVRYVAKPDAAICICIKRTAGLFLLVYLVLVAILPITIYGTSQLSKTITEPLRANVSQSLHRAQRVFSLESITQKDSLLDKIDAIKIKANEIINFCKSNSPDFAASLAKLGCNKNYGCHHLSDSVFCFSHLAGARHALSGTWSQR
jgi:hypothetical protein